MSKIDNTLYFGFFCITALLIFVTWFFWGDVKADFFKYNLIDVIQVIITIIIGSYITSRLTIKSANDLKQKEISFDLFSNLQEKTESAFILGESYIQNPNDCEPKRITQEMRKLSNQIDLIKKLKTKKNNFEEKVNNIENNFFKFKAALTGGGFGQNNPTYNSEEILQFKNSYDIIIKTIYEIKIQIYSL